MGLEAATFIGELVDSNPTGSDGLGAADDHVRVLKAVLQNHFANFGSSVQMTATEAELNLLAGYLGSSIPDFGVVGVWTKQQYFGTSSLVDATNISWDLDDAQVATISLSGNRTLDNPSNIQDGAVYTLIVKQDATGSRTLAYDTDYKWSGGLAPVLSTGSFAVDILCFVSDGTSLYGAINLDVR